MSCRLLVITTALLGSFGSYAQDNPMRIGLKIGLPNLVGLHLEYVTPLLNERLAPSVDVSYIPFSFQDPDSDFTYGTGEVNFRFSYIEVGANYYFFKPGRGLYGNVSYGRLGLNYDFLDYYSEENDLAGGVGKLDVGFNLLNLKIGAKLGRSFYFRPELGFALVGASADNIAYTVRYPDGTTETASEDLPNVLVGGSPVFNLGFGMSF